MENNLKNCMKLGSHVTAQQTNNFINEESLQDRWQTDLPVR